MEPRGEEKELLSDKEESVFYEDLEMEISNELRGLAYGTSFESSVSSIPDNYKPEEVIKHSTTEESSALAHRLVYDQIKRFDFFKYYCFTKPRYKTLTLEVEQTHLDNPVIMSEAANIISAIGYNVVIYWKPMTGQSLVYDKQGNLDTTNLLHAKYILVTRPYKTEDKYGTLAHYVVTQDVIDKQEKIKKKQWNEKSCFKCSVQ